MINCENQSHACCGGRESAVASDAVRGAAARSAVAVLRCYQRWISPVLPPTCRFHPSCSEYAREAIAKYGFARGGWLALKRLCRCHALHPGGFDPVQ
ncbi:MAG: membrane protein insertion efficiency factor YidD [Armatimonadota bacterium]|nr:MAG: membrane protein insertion efficiency factor YidD [Armatimonadota bacterium]